MNLNVLKYTGLGIVGALLLYANINMLGKLFFPSQHDHEIILGIKDVVKPSNDEIAELVKDIYISNDNGNDSLIITDDPIESNKRNVLVRRFLGGNLNGETAGYVYIIHERIPCGFCSDVNYLLVTDSDYRIKRFIHLRNIIESNLIVLVEEFEEFTNQFLGMSLLKDDFSETKVIPKPQKHSKYFSQSVKSIQKQVRLFYEG